VGVVRITVDDREDESIIHLPEDYFGQVELSFRAGVLVSTRKSETLDKGKLKTTTDEHRRARTDTDRVEH